MSESQTTNQTKAPIPAPSNNDKPAVKLLPGELPYPEETQPPKILWQHVIVLTAVHLISLLALIPWFFTWSGLIVAILGHFIFGMLGITIGYHRLLTHRGFTCPKWLEYTFATMGSHVGWVLYRHKDTNRTIRYAKWVPDLLRDPYYRRLERNSGWFMVYFFHAIVIVAIGAIVGYLEGGTSEALHYAASWAVWGIAVRTVFVLHGTWSVNSLAHLYGYRNYETRDQSTNNWLVALIAHGEGWHNNHHADPRSASHGHRWFEFDMSYWVIRILEGFGLAKNVVRPRRGKANSRG